MGSSDGARLGVLTLLYDPTGGGIDLFRQCIASVQAQRDVTVDWSVSVSAAAPEYDELLDAIERDGVGTVQRQVGVTELGQHLTVALPLVGQGKAHILCHDDAYAGPSSAARIARALDSAPALIVAPVGWAPPAAPASVDPPASSVLLRAESRGSRRRETWGINRAGGLSTVAWVGGAQALRGDPRYNLLADLAVRRQLRVAYDRLHVLEGGMVREARWPGQSQFTLAERAEAERAQWLADSGLPSWLSRVTPTVARLHRAADRVSGRST